MKQTRLAFLFFLLIAGQLRVNAQNIFPQGYFTSETNTIGAGNDILVSVKKYNPTAAEIANASNYKEGAPMNYLMAPYEIENGSLFDKGLESMLYLLNSEGKVKWEKSLGYSDKSKPSPIKLSGGYIFTGESLKEESKVLIQKIGLDGKVVWKKELDSLHNVNDIYIDENKVNLLVSFDVSKREERGNQFSIRTYAIYFFMQLDLLNGAVTKKEYQNMGNYLSGMNFSNPVMNSAYSYFLNNRDTAFYLSVNNQKNATIIPADMSKDHSILRLMAAPGSYHLLTSYNIGGKKVYKLITDFYSKEKKYEALLKIPYSGRNREFLYKTLADSVLTVIGDNQKTFIAYTDIRGETTYSSNTSSINSPIIGIGELSGKIYLIKMEGRDKPGAIGTMKIEYP